MSHTAPGGRSSSRRVEINTTTVLALVLPLLTIGALLLVRPQTVAETTHPPTRTALTTASVVCPSALPGTTETRLSTAEKGVSGSVTLTSDGAATGARVAAGTVTTADRGDGPLTVTGEDDLAPGLVAARSGSGPLVAVACPATSPDQWFTALGAGARHSSVVELVNPDSGPAVADVALYAVAGRIDVPRLRGVSVPGHSSVRLDLGAVVPRRGELALRVLTSRGRLAASVVDTYDELGAGERSVDWLPAQPAPSRDSLLMGLPGGEGKRTLVLANPGDDEIRASLEVVTQDSVFAPEGLAEIRVAPESVTRLQLGGAALAAVRDGGLGLRVTSTGPLTATLRSFVAGDLSHAVAGTPVTGAARVIVPEGPKQVVLAGADAVGAVTVTGWSAAGERLVRTRAEIVPGRGAVVELPDGAVLVSVVPERTPVTGSVVVTGDGAAVVPLRELVRNGLVPVVRPGLP